MKKLVSMSLAALMVLSICTLPAMAATTLETILENYEPADEANWYVNSFDNAADATRLGGDWYNTAGDEVIAGNSLDTFGWDETSKRFKVTRGQYETLPGNTTIYSASTEDMTTTDTKLCLITFKAQVDTSLGYVQYRLSTNSPKNYQALIQISSSGELRYRGSGGWQYVTGGITAGTENTYAFLMNYTDNTFSLWVNQGTDLSHLTSENAVVKDFAMSTTNRDFSGYFTMAVNDNLSDIYGSMYLDDFTVAPLVAKSVEEPEPETPSNMPTYTGTPSYEETFDKAESTENFITAGIADTNTGDLSIVTDSSNSNNKYLQVSNASSQAHYWYFSKKEGYETPANNIVIQADIKTTNAFYANLGAGGDNSCILVYSTNIVDNNVKRKVTDIRNRNEFTTITWMIGKDNSLSMWIGEERVFHSFKSNNLALTSKVNGDLSKIDCINFRPQGSNSTMLVDNIRVFEAADNDFLKVDTVLRKVQSAVDCSPATGDGIISDLSTDVVLDGLADTTGYTVTFSDTKSYWNGSNMIFPLWQDTADITVKVEYGEVSDEKIFEDVTIPAAYNFTDIDWGTDTPVKGEVFDSAVIKATARNTASDTDGRLKIVAALYDSEGTELKLVKVQNDTLTENGASAEGFAVILDLTDVTELPANPVVKVFVWENGTLTPLGSGYSKSF